MAGRRVLRDKIVRSDTVVDADATVILIGDRIRALRTQGNLTLETLAERTGLSSSMLSLVERGKTSPSIGSLVAIASALGVHMRDLFDNKPDRSEEKVVRADEQPVFVTGDGVSRRIARTDNERGVELAIYEYAPGAGSKGRTVQHGGFEYGVVLQGRLTVKVNDELHQLDPGDSIAYQSGLPHKIFNEGRKNVRAVWIDVERPV